MHGYLYDWKPMAKRFWSEPRYCEHGNGRYTGVTGNKLDADLALCEWASDLRVLGRHGNPERRNCDGDWNYHHPSRRQLLQHGIQRYLEQCYERSTHLVRTQRH
jgi:hypothetical protein